MTRPLILLALAMGMMGCNLWAEVIANRKTKMRVEEVQFEVLDAHKLPFKVEFKDPKSGNYFEIIFSTNGTGADLRWSLAGDTTQEHRINPSDFCKACPRCPS